ncbi:MAG: adenylosuccinate synthase [Calditrichaeota bacterium]|nr:adenylosuccinate synthase [Calditrichota bacterium]
MPVTVVVGGQWGDEGKGKIVDILAQDANIIARYQGGANAGHTVVYNGRKYVLHLVPSGILNARTICALGAGCVIDPARLLDEIDGLISAGINVDGRLFISHQAHLILPYHKILDALNEKRLGDGAIGVTGQGIGPAYTDKYSRCGIRMVDLLDKDTFIEKVKVNVEYKNRIIKELYNEPTIISDSIVSDYLGYRERLLPLIKDVSVLLNSAIADGRVIICEGAQGTLLDIDWGTYPYVTSSHSTAGGAVIGLGIGPTRIDKVLGVIKAYTTRVGKGLFPTEFEAEMQCRIRAAGAEFGATTGRARRCGWFDAVITRYAARLNSVDSWALTKLDVLSQLKTLQICVAYEYEGQRYEQFPPDMRIVERGKPIYDELEGWNAPIDEVRRLSGLPKPAHKYIERLAELTGAPIEMVSVGRERGETIFIE